MTERVSALSLPCSASHQMAADGAALKKHSNAQFGGFMKVH